QKKVVIISLFLRPLSKGLFEGVHRKERPLFVGITYLSRSSSRLCLMKANDVSSGSVLRSRRLRIISHHQQAQIATCLINAGMFPEPEPMNNNIIIIKIPTACL